MKRLLLLALLAFPIAIGAQQFQTTTFSQTQDQQHTVVGTQYGNATVTFPIQNGIATHQFSWTAPASVTGLTVTLAAGVGSSPSTIIGTFTATSGRTVFTGPYTIASVTYSNYVGSGAVDADYQGLADIRAVVSGMNSGTLVPITVDARGNVQVAAPNALPTFIAPGLPKAPCNAIVQTNCQPRVY